MKPKLVWHQRTPRNINSTLLLSPSKMAEQPGHPYKMFLPSLLVLMAMLLLMGEMVPLSPNMMEE